MNCPPIIYSSPFHFFLYYCSDCDLECSFKSKYDRHLESKGHHLFSSNKSTSLDDDLNSGEVNETVDDSTDIADN